MTSLPAVCRDINTVGAFCDCIAGDRAADPAAKAFCRRAADRSDPYVTGDDLAELKKALRDLEE